jgi:glycine cleavage system H protein
MSDAASDLTFMMAKHPALLRADRQYCKNHMWCQRHNDRLRFGFSAYAIRLMQDVYFLEWKFDAPRTVAAKEEIGFLESSKAQSGLYAPIAGTITQFNTTLLNDPSGINSDGYGEGWLFEMEPANSATEQNILSMQQYHEFLETNWEVTQRIIKKQVLE